MEDKNFLCNSCFYHKEIEGTYGVCRLKNLSITRDVSDGCEFIEERFANNGRIAKYKEADYIKSYQPTDSNECVYLESDKSDLFCHINGETKKITEKGCDECKDKTLEENVIVRHFYKPNEPNTECLCETCRYLRFNILAKEAEVDGKKRFCIKPDLSCEARDGFNVMYFDGRCPLYVKKMDVEQENRYQLKRMKLSLV